MNKILVASFMVALLVIATLAWLGRYDIEATGNGMVFRLDRWTGVMEISIAGDPWEVIRPPVVIRPPFDLDKEWGEDAVAPGNAPSK